MSPACLRWPLLLLLALSAAAAAADAAEEDVEEAPSPGDQQLAEQDMLGVRLVTHPDCRADIHRLCADDNSITLNDKTPNIDVIGCLLDKQEEEENTGLSKGCHNVLWQLRNNLTRSTTLVRAVASVCPNERFSDCEPSDPNPGHYVSCVMEHLDDVEDDGCAEFLENLGIMIFSDYRMVFKFVEDCGSDVDKFQCGRLEEGDEKTHSQGKTIECVSTHMDELSDACKLQVMRVAELQAEDYHMDRPLYFACREDRERFCARVVSGNGRVYQCLIQHKMEEDMSKKCARQLTRRQRLTSADYKVSKRLRKACKSELAASGCHQVGGMPVEAGHSVKLSLVLLCLENHQKTGNAVSGECIQEVMDHRRALMEDYTLSPEVVVSCNEDIQRLCKEETERKGGQVIHCLMQHANPARFSEEVDRVSDQCLRQVEQLLTVAEVGSDWKVDPVLQKACAPVVRQACQDVQGPEVLSCLAETLGSDAMTPNCEQVLLQIQYFLSRDFKLDASLYKACHQDATRLCDAPDQWWQPEEAEGGVARDPNVLPCLYRNIYHSDETENQVSEVCRGAVRRVLRYRAGRADLHPHVQASCMEDLVAKCSEHTQRGREIACLQEFYSKLQAKCQKAIKAVTQDQGRYIELNGQVAKHCKAIIKQNCMEAVQAGGEGVMECLIRQKSDPDVRMADKCWAAINHFQLLSLEDYTFSHRFHKHCRQDVTEYCKDSSQTKADIIQCLSGAMLADTLEDKTQRISKACRKEVQFQLREREENEALDPRLNTQCGPDIHQFCKDESENKGSGKVLECLREHVDELTKECSKLLFRRQQQSLILPKADYYLFTACKGMILKYCPSPELRTGADVLDCLKTQTEEPSFDPACAKVVSRRLAEQKRDYRLHPALRSACKKDAETHCARELAAARSGGLPAQGQVTGCLARAFRQGAVSRACGRQVDIVLREAARDIRQDPLLASDCREDISRFCRDQPPEEVGNCLREKLAEGSSLSTDCARRVARIVEDVNVDVHTDPQLSAACALDLQRHCAQVPRGNGAQLNCLMELHDPTARCANMLTLRMKMMEKALKVRPAETVEDLIVTVRDSPSRDYFILLVAIILIIMFFGGLVCGRATKRARYMQKTK